MHRFIAEIRRRKVHRAAVLYLLGGYAAIEASDLLVPLLQLPDWSTRLVLALVLAGFPLAMALAWTFQVTKSGIVRTREIENDRSPAVPLPVPVRPAKSSDERISILVAPFSNTSPDPENEYIADGLTDEIITDLSRIESLRVISRSSTMRLKGAGDRVAEAARELDVDYLLDGTVRKAGDHLRITVQLIHLDSDASHWTERYTGTLNDLFGIQEEVARSVARSLALHLGSIEGTRAAAGLEDSRAVEGYLRARYEMWQFSEQGLAQAERHLRNCLAITGDNTLLLASLGHVYAWYAQLGLDPDGAWLSRAAECVERIFSIEPDSARGYRLLGTVRFHGGDLRSARAPLERALAGKPSDPDTLMMLGYLCALCGQHDRARALFQKGLDVDPLTPLNNAMDGLMAVLEGRPHDALDPYRRYRDMDPESPFAVWCWVWVLLMNGMADEAEPAVITLVTAHADSIFTPLGEALLHGVRGDATAAGAAITPEVLAAGRTNELFSRELTHCFALANRREDALGWLENTIRIGNVNHPFWSRHDPLVENIRGEPRFAELMEQVRREWRSLNPELAI